MRIVPCIALLVVVSACDTPSPDLPVTADVTDTAADASDTGTSDVVAADAADIGVTDTADVAPDASQDVVPDAPQDAGDTADTADAADTAMDSGTPDRDEDGVPDDSDNCPDDANPVQADTDDDGLGNACDAVAWEGLSDGDLVAAMAGVNAARYDPPGSRYQDARRWMFEQVDNHDGNIMCVYTGAVIRSYIEPDADDMNAEHTWPQSLGADEVPMRADLHHLFPSLASVNNARGRLPFCEVDEGTEDFSQGGSRRGRSAGEDCFEPRDAHKGDAARAMLYFAAMYTPTLDAAQEAVLLGWHAAHPPTAEDVARNDAVEAWMGTRNPFVDYPDLAGRIADH